MQCSLSSGLRPSALPSARRPQRPVRRTAAPLGVRAVQTPKKMAAPAATNGAASKPDVASELEYERKYHLATKSTDNDKLYQSGKPRQGRPPQGQRRVPTQLSCQPPLPRSCDCRI